MGVTSRRLDLVADGGFECHVAVTWRARVDLDAAGRCSLAAKAIQAELGFFRRLRSCQPEQWVDLQLVRMGRVAAPAAPAAYASHSSHAQP